MNYNRKFRRTSAVAISLTGVGAFLLSGCTPADGGSSASEDRVLRFSHVYEASHPFETCAISTLKNELEASDTGLSVVSYPAGQLANDQESLEQISTGTLDLAISGGAFLGTWYEPMAVLDAAYLFDDAAHLKSVISSGSLNPLYDDLAAETGLKIQSTWYYGTRHLTANIEVQSPKDLAGVKVRTPNAPMFMRNTELMGGVPTPMSLGELYLGLQQGVVDAQENPIPTIDSNNLQDVQDWINLTHHQVQGLVVVSSDSLNESLSVEQNEALEGGMAAAAEAVYECVTTAESDILAQWVADGSINVNDSIDQNVFAEDARRAYSNDPVIGESYSTIREGR